MPGFIEQMVIETIETYDRMADEYRKKADALRAEWQSLQVDKPTEQQVDSDGWIEWAGGVDSSPVADGTLTQVRLRSGIQLESRRPAWWRWWHEVQGDVGYMHDIVAYKIVKEKETPATS